MVFSLYSSERHRRKWPVRWWQDQ